MNCNNRIKWMSVFFLLLFFIGVADCSADDAEKEPLIITTIWNAPYIKGSSSALDFSDAPYIVQVQRRGFEKGMAAYEGNVRISELMLSEQDEFENVVESLASLYNNNNVLMSVGASSDVMTMYTAMETSFFNISYLIPFSDAELLSDGLQGYTVRLTVTGKKYADYIGSELLPVNMKDVINTALFEDKQVPDYSITAAVFFKDNFNDHDTAVEITQRLMDNGIDIQYHMAYPSGGRLNTITQCWNDSLGTLPDIDAVIIMGEDHDPMSDLPEILKLWEERQILPVIILIGYDPEYIPLAVRSADNLYILEQSLDKTNCPADVVTDEEAMGYVAGYVTMKVLDRANQSQPEKPGGLHYKLLPNSQKIEEMETYWDKFRATVRTELVAVNEDIPCYGILRLNASSDNNAKIELMQVDSSGMFTRAESSDISARILSLKRLQFRITD